MYPGRTTPELLAGIVEIDTDTWPDTSPFIDEANELVTEYCVDLPASLGSPAYSTHRLELIERNMAAHLYRSGPDNAVSSERADVVSESVQHKVGFGFKYTPYGMNAMRLDTLGNLAVLDALIEQGHTTKPNATVTYLGRSSPHLRPRRNC